METIQHVESLLEQSETLLKEAGEFKQIGYQENLGKLLQKIKAETLFLKRLKQDPSLLVNCKASSSNFMYLNGLFNLMKHERSCMVFKSFPVDTKDKKVTIDLVSDDGLRWIKLRMCSSFEHKIEFEESDSSSDSEVDEVEGIAPIVKQALGLKRAAFLNQFHFKEPEIEYKFLSMQSEDFPPVVLNSLTAIGIKVSFGLNENTKLDGYHYLTNTVNLDVTTLIAMVSDISHRFATIPAEAFDSKPLVMQRAMEANSQILPALSKIFKGRKLVCCLAAFEKFREIVSTIGGPFEQSRAKYLFPDKDLGIRTDLVRNEVESLGWSIEVVPNKVPANFGTKTLIDLNTNIFGTGNAMKISTISSNQGFKRSLEHAGGSESILIHEPRGLIEQKWLKVSSATPSSIHNGGIH